MLFCISLLHHTRNIQIGKSLRIVARQWSNTKQWRRIKKSNEIMIPCRDDPVVLKLDTPEFHSIFSPELETLINLFKKYNHELRIAGGAVRDMLMGLTPKDLDFATDATPKQMKEIFNKENIRLINMNGEKHGTITPRINDKENFECTTLRIDVVTDGRHADIEFTTDWKLDAHRRDLTINSMFLDFDGRVYDYFYGYDDLKKRKIKFVGDPETRIQEDYLRIFRYFRFHGRISENPNDHEENTIAKIKENVSGLERISGERIWSEWSKIIDGRFGGELTLKMLECGMAPYMGLPEQLNTEHFKEIYYRLLENNVKVKPITLVASLLNNQQEMTNLTMRLKLSAFDRDLGMFLIAQREPKISEKPLKPYQAIVLHSADKRKIRAYVSELLKYTGKFEILDDFEAWVLPKFPITGSDLKPLMPQAQMMTPVLKQLKNIWLDNDCKTDAHELMKHVPKIVADLQG